MHRRYGWLSASIIFVAIIGITLARAPFFARADLAVFYPQSCLGGWTNTFRAAGAPSLSGDINPGQFNSDNSAVLDGSAAQIFCGGFAGTIPADTLPKKAVVSFVWAMRNRAVPDAPAAPQDATASTSTPQTIIVTSDSATSSLEQVLGSATSTPDARFDVVFASTTPDQSQSQAPASMPSPAPASSEPAPDSEAPAPADAGPASFLYHLLPTAHAQEAATSSSATSTGLTAAAGSLYSVLHTASEDFLEVSYTIDGVSWHSLGKVDKDNFMNASFEIPREDVSRWEDISKFQVSVQSLSTIDDAPAVYLDAVALSVTYASNEAEAPNKDQQFVNLPKVQVDGTKLFEGSRKVFGAQEDARFEMDLGNVVVASSTSVSASSSDAAPATSSGSTDSVPIPTPALETAPTGTTTSKAIWGRALGFLSGLIPTASAQAPPPDGLVTASIVGPGGDTLPIEPVLQDLGTKISVTVPRPAESFRPGRYTLHVTFVKDGMAYTSSQDFKWGVLAVNTDRSIYSPGQDAYLQMAVLNDTGHAVCKADLRLTIDGPGGLHHVFSTDDGSIERNPGCRSNNVTDEPDYSAHFTPPMPGAYAMILLDIDNGNEINDSFEARASVPFDVVRTAATRINPFLSAYVMHVHVLAKQSFLGPIIEPVPAGFQISAISSGGQVISPDTGSSTGQEVSWPVDLSAGDSLDLTYTYQAPQVSPEFYEAGPLSFRDQTTGDSTFTEARQWQIASDAACTAAAATFNWGTAASWSGCAGGGIPTAADDLTIPSGAVITVNVANAVAHSISFSAPTAATSITISGSNDLNVGGGTGTITFTKAASTLTSTLAVGAGTVECGTVTMNGGSSTGTNALTVSTGVITVTGDMAFAFSTTKPTITFSSTGNIKMTGNYNAGATLTATAGTLTFNGSSDQKIATSSGNFFNITINKTGGAALVQGATTVAGTLAITNGILADNAFQITGNSTNLFTMAAGTQLWLGTTTTATATTFPGTFTAAHTTLSAGSTVYYYANLAQTISNTPAYANLTIGTGASTVTKTAGGALTINGDFTMTASPIQFNSGTSLSHIVKGNWVNNSTHGQSFVYTTANTITFSGTAAQAVSGSIASTTFRALTISNTAAPVTFNINTNVTGAFTVNASAVVSPVAAAVFNSTAATGTITGTGKIQVTRTAATADYVNQYKFTTNTLTNLTVDYAGTGAQTVASSVTYGHLLISNTAAAVTLGGNLSSVSGTTTVSAGAVLDSSAFTFGSTGQIDIDGTWQGTGAITLGGRNIDGLGSITNTGLLSISSTGKFVMPTANLTIASPIQIVGAQTMTNAGTIVLTSSIGIWGSTGASKFVQSANANVSVAGNFMATSSVDVSATGNTITFNGTASNQAATGTTYYNLIINDSGKTVTPAANVVVSNALTISNGTLNMNGKTMSVSGLATISGGTYQASTASSTFNGGLTLSGGTFTGSSGGVDVNGGGLTLTSGTFTAPAGLFFVTGNWSENSGAAFIPGTGTTTFDGTSGTQTISGTLTGTNNDFNNVSFVGGAAKTFSNDASTTDFTVGATAGTITPPSNLSVAGSFTNSGVYAGASNTTLYLTGASKTHSGAFIGTSQLGNVMIQGSGTVMSSNASTTNLIINSGAALTAPSQLSVAGSFTNSGVFSNNSGTIYSIGNTGSFNGTLTGLSALGNVVITGPLLSLNASASTTDMDIGNSILALSGQLSIAGNFLGSSGSMTVLSNTVYFSGTSGTQTISFSTANHLFSNVVFLGGAAKTITGSASTTDFTIASGSGIVTAPSDIITISGNYSNAGTFVPNGGSVYFASSTGQTISGSTTWHNLNITATTTRTVSFQSGQTQTIDDNGSLTLNGDATHVLTLAPLTPASAWKLAISTTGVTQSVLYASASYSDASGSANFNQQVNAANAGDNDGGHNTNWNFSSLTFTTDGTSESFSSVISGVVAATSSILTVTTSNTTGFNITLQRGDPTGTMSFGSTYIPDKTDWIPNAATTSPGNATASTTQPFTLQFRVRLAGTDAPNYASSWWGTDDTTPNALFAGIPSSAQPIVKRSTSAGSGTVATVLYDLNVPATQPVGTYSGSITYTVTANP